MTKNQKPILYAAAFDENNRIVLAAEGPRRRPYICINCRNPMKLRRGLKNRPHFAHINKDFDYICSPETVLHNAFKITLHERFQEHIARSIRLPVRWNCRLCGKPHEANLIKSAHESRLEYAMGDFVADVALLDQDHAALCAVEIVVTNSPEDEKVAYYKDSGIWLVLFKLESDTDIEKARDTPLTPTSFDFCPEAFRKKAVEPGCAEKAVEGTSTAVPHHNSNEPYEDGHSGETDNFSGGSYSKLIKRIALILLIVVAMISVYLLWQRLI